MIQPVNLEIAKLLKEKGFNEPCDRFIRLDNLDILNFSDGTKYVYPGFKNVKEYIKVLDETMLLAPTIAEVVSWIYKEHNYWISVLLSDYTFDHSVYHLPPMMLDYWKYDFKTPEEAYIDAIVHVLTFLI